VRLYLKQNPALAAEIEAKIRAKLLPSAAEAAPAPEAAAAAE